MCLDLKTWQVTDLGLDQKDKSLEGFGFSLNDKPCLIQFASTLASSHLTFKTQDIDFLNEQFLIIYSNGGQKARICSFKTIPQSKI